MKIIGEDKKEFKEHGLVNTRLVFRIEGLWPRLFLLVLLFCVCLGTMVFFYFEYNRYQIVCAGSGEGHVRVYRLDKKTGEVLVQRGLYHLDRLTPYEDMEPLDHSADQ